MIQASNISVRGFTGDEMERYIPELSRLRIEVFRDFPYLYDGSYEYEETYLKTYVDSPGSVIVLAMDDDKIIGASTGMPMQNETDEIKRPFIEQGYDTSKVFYFAESVLNKSYRGHGIGVQFFNQREAHVNEQGGFDYTCFCGVERPLDHPLRPVDFVPLNAFWNKRGYVRQPELKTTISWLDLDEAAETQKTMVFWMKSIKSDSVL